MRILPLVLALSACSVAVPPGDAPSDARTSKVEVCHRVGADWRVLSVGAPALSAHLGHGDALPGAYFADADGDGFGAGAASLCPNGGVDAAGDCDDSAAAVSPGAAEVCNGVDDDCDPSTIEDCGPEDADGDGYDADADCDDSNAAVNPAATEICGDDLDNDCDGKSEMVCVCPCFTRSDLDAYYAESLTRTTNSASCEDNTGSALPEAHVGIGSMEGLVSYRGFFQVYSNVFGGGLVYACENTQSSFGPEGSTFTLEPGGPFGATAFADCYLILTDWAADTEISCEP